MAEYDVLVIGPVSLDHNIDCLGNERREVGGAVVASGFAAARSGNRTAVFTKLDPADADLEQTFAGSGAQVFWSPSKATCSIRNQYFTPDKEKRPLHLGGPARHRHRHLPLRRPGVRGL